MARPEPAGDRSTFKRSLWAAATIVLFAALSVPAALYLGEQPASELRLEIATPPTRFPQHFALSPDGRSIVYVALDASNGAHLLYFRELDADPREAEPVAGTEDARFPFWSPDGGSLGFFASNRLYVIDDFPGGPARSLAAAFYPLGGSWNQDGMIIFTPDTVSPMLRIPAAGGDAAEVIDSWEGQTNQRFPTFLPDGRTFLFYAVDERGAPGLYSGSLDNGGHRRLAATDSTGVFTEPDLVVFIQEGTLVARRLDLSRSELMGRTLRLASSIEPGNLGALAFSASSTGLLAYRTSRERQLRATMVDASGMELEIFDRLLNCAEFSPDGRYVAFDLTVDGNRDVWTIDLIRGGERRLTSHDDTDGYPVWSPDGKQLVFESNRNGTFDLWEGRFDLPDEETHLFGDSTYNEIPLDWSDDGRYVLFMRANAEYASADLLALPMSGTDRTPIVVAAEPGSEERTGSLSPDSRWVAYDTDRSGRSEIVVQAFPEPDGRIFLSQAGGAAPRWSDDGGEIYFLAPDQTLMMARVVATETSFDFETPRPLFPTRSPPNSFNQPYAAYEDPDTGETLFLFNYAQADENATPITLIQNWSP